MIYADTGKIIDDMLAIYDSSALSTSSLRRPRMLHYINRAAEELWVFRNWPFTLTKTTIDFVSGVGALPNNYGGISDGGLYDPDGRSWVEVPFDDLMSENIKNVNTRLHLYALADTSIYLADVTNNQTFTFVYQMQLSSFTDGQALTPFPPMFGRAILLGASMLLKRDEGDARSAGEYMQEYKTAQSQLAKTFMPLRSRPMQMPMAVGNGRW